MKSTITPHLLIFNSPIKEHKYTPYYEVMWWYVAGVLYNRCKASQDFMPLIRFWHLVETEPRELVGIKHVNLQIRCLDECEVDEGVSIHKGIMNNIQKWGYIKHVSKITEALILSNKVSGKITPELLKALEDSESCWVRRSAVEALGEVGLGHGDLIIPHLIEALKDKDYFVSTSSKDALKLLNSCNLDYNRYKNNTSIRNNSKEALDIFSINKLESECDNLIRIIVNKPWAWNLRCDDVIEARIKLNTIVINSQNLQLIEYVIHKLIENDTGPMMCSAIRSTFDQILKSLLIYTVYSENIVKILIAYIKENRKRRYLAAERLVCCTNNISDINLANEVASISITQLNDKKNKNDWVYNSFMIKALGKVLIKIEDSELFNKGIKLLLLALNNKIYDKDSALDALGKVGVGQEERVGYIIAEKVTSNKDIIKISSKKSSKITTLHCFKKSSNLLWIKQSFDHFQENQSYATFQGNTLIVKDSGRTHEIEFSEEQKKIFLEVFRQSAVEMVLPTEVYNYYLRQGTLGFRNELGVIEKTELHIAAERGDLDAVKSILIQGIIDINNQNNERRETPLILAAQNSHIGVVKYLINQGADATCLNRANDDALNISLFIKQDMQQSSIILEKYFITDQRLKRLLERGMMSYNGKSDDNTVSEIVYEITGNERLKDWKNDLGLCRTYKMYLENIIEVRHEHQQSAVRVNGSYSDEVLGIRLYLYIDLYLKLQRGMEVELPFRESGEKLFKEIKIIIDTIIGERFRDYCISYQDQHGLIENRAETISKKLGELKVGEEYVIRSGYEGDPGHCLYVSFAKIREDRVVARVDNRWIREGRIDGEKHKEYTKQEGRIRNIKSYYVGTFALTSNQQDLAQYIIGVIQAMFINPEAGLENIYGVNLSENIRNITTEVGSYIESWPYHPIQSNDNGNCTLSSYNLGISVRYGEEFFEWLLSSESRQLVSRNPRRNTNLSIENTRRENETDSNTWTERIGNNKEGIIEVISHESETIGTKFTHIKLMEQFQKELNASWDGVYDGVVVEQALVSIAGINTIQTDAQFRADEENQSTITRFSLRFSNEEELEKFVNYYNEKFPGLIIQEEIRYQDGGLTDINMDTSILYNQVAEFLGSNVCQENQRGCCLS